MIGFLFTSVVLSAQDVDELIRMAADYNPGLKALNLEYEAALLKAEQVDDWPDPTFNLALGVLPIETRLGAQRLRMGVSQMIPWKGSIQAKKDVANLMAESKSSLDDVKVIEIEYAIRKTYYQLQFLQSKRAIVQEKLLVLEALGELATSGVKSGKGKLSNVLLVERQKGVIEADLALLDKKIEQPTILINRWTGRPLDTEIQTTVDQPVLFEKEQIQNYAQSAHPLYSVLDQKIAASNSMISLTKYQAKPQIGIGLDYSVLTRRADVDIPGNGRDVLMPMVNISIPLHTGRYDAIRQEETIKQQALFAEREEIIDSYTSEVELAYSTIEYQDQVISKFESLKEITSEILELMRTEFASDGTRFEELLRLEMELINYNLQILESEYEKNMAKATLYKFN
jgi:outer membrane protein TolC